MNGSQSSGLESSPRRGMRARNRSIRSLSRTPNTARRITSSVIACMRGRSAKGRPSGQRSTSRAVASAITSV
jgi:hypothetical protein